MLGFMECPVCKMEVANDQVEEHKNMHEQVDHAHSDDDGHDHGSH